LLYRPSNGAVDLLIAARFHHLAVVPPTKIS